MLKILLLLSLIWIIFILDVFIAKESLLLKYVQSIKIENDKSILERFRKFIIKLLEK